MKKVVYKLMILTVCIAVVSTNLSFATAAERESVIRNKAVTAIEKVTSEDTTSKNIQHSLTRYSAHSKNCTINIPKNPHDSIKFCTNTGTLSFKIPQLGSLKSATEIDGTIVYDSKSSDNTEYAVQALRKHNDLNWNRDVK